MPWYDCCDILVKDDDGNVIHDGPKFLRCMYPADCGIIVTHGMLERNDGICECGGRKFGPALRLKAEEREALLNGDTPLNEWEQMIVGNDEI